MAAFHEQEQPTALSEQEPQGQRPIDRLRQLLTEAQAEHLEFLTPHGKKVLLCTDRYFESRHSPLKPPKEHDVVVTFGDSISHMVHPIYEFDEQLWFTKDSVKLTSGHAKIAVDSPLLGHTERPKDEEYDRLANRALQIIRWSTPFTPPAR